MQEYTVSLYAQNKKLLDENLRLKAELDEALENEKLAKQSLDELEKMYEEHMLTYQEHLDEVDRERIAYMEATRQIKELMAKYQLEMERSFPQLKKQRKAV